MKAVFMEGLSRLALKELPNPIIAEGEVLVKVDSCAICGSDIRIFEKGNKRVKYPTILGHEIAGTVVESRNRMFKAGDRLAFGADIPCGKCVWCKKGFSNNCENNIAFGYEYQGGFAEYLKLDRRIIEYGPVAAISKTADISQDELSISEPLGCCINGMERCGDFKKKDILILGAGPIGVIFAKLAKINCALRVILCDIDEDRLKIVKIPGVELMTIPGLRKTNKKFDVIIVACPSLKAQEDAFSYIKKRGIINFFGGLPENSKDLSISSNKIHYDEISVVGSHGSTPIQHKNAVDLIINRKIIVDDLISKRFPLDKLNEAMKEAKNKKNLKVIINP